MEPLECKSVQKSLRLELAGWLSSFFLIYRFQFKTRPFHEIITYQSHEIEIPFVHQAMNFFCEGVMRVESVKFLSFLEFNFFFGNEIKTSHAMMLSSWKWWKISGIFRWMIEHFIFTSVRQRVSAVPLSFHYDKSSRTKSIQFRNGDF